MICRYIITCRTSGQHRPGEDGEDAPEGRGAPSGPMLVGIQYQTVLRHGGRDPELLHIRADGTSSIRCRTNRPTGSTDEGNGDPSSAISPSAPENDGYVHPSGPRAGRDTQPARPRVCVPLFENLADGTLLTRREPRAKERSALPPTILLMNFPLKRYDYIDIPTYVHM